MAEEKICEICGLKFISQYRAQTCCCRECERRRRRMSAETQAEEDKIAKRRKEARARGSQAQKTDWSEIVRKLDALGKSYGQAVKEGLL